MFCAAPVDDQICQLDDGRRAATGVGQRQRADTIVLHKIAKEFWIGAGEGRVNRLVGIADPHPIAMRPRSAGATSALAGHCCPAPHPPTRRANAAASGQVVAVGFKGLQRQQNQVIEIDPTVHGQAALIISVNLQPE